MEIPAFTSLCSVDGFVKGRKYIFFVINVNDVEQFTNFLLVIRNVFQLNIFFSIYSFIYEFFKSIDFFHLFYGNKSFTV